MGNQCAKMDLHDTNLKVSCLKALTVNSTACLHAVGTVLVFPVAKIHQGFSRFLSVKEGPSHDLPCLLPVGFSYTIENLKHID